MTITADPSDGELIVHADYDPFTLTLYKVDESGSKELVKNNTRVTYFNYGNMRYRRVYNRGPLEEREPFIIPTRFSWR